MDAVDTLCENLLPFILVPGDSLTQTSHHYVPAMIQTVMYKVNICWPNLDLISFPIVICDLCYYLNLIIFQF